MEGLRGGVARCAADIIDWTDLGSSIFDRKNPLAEKTLARIAEGIRRYVLNDPAPFVLRVTKTGGAGKLSRRDGPEEGGCGVKGGKTSIGRSAMAKRVDGKGGGKKGKGGGEA